MSECGRAGRPLHIAAPGHAQVLLQPHSRLQLVNLRVQRRHLASRGGCVSCGRAVVLLILRLQEPGRRRERRARQARPHCLLVRVVAEQLRVLELSQPRVAPVAHQPSHRKAQQRSAREGWRGAGHGFPRTRQCVRLRGARAARAVRRRRRYETAGSRTACRDVSAPAAAQPERGVGGPRRQVGTLASRARVSAHAAHPLAVARRAWLVPSAPL